MYADPVVINRYPLITRSEVFEFIRFAIKSNGLNPDDPRYRVTVEWSERMTRAAGTATYQLGLIKLSTKLLPRSTPEDQRQTVIHEACHLISFWKYGEAGTGHGHYWKACMRACGLAPRRCHSIPRAGLRRGRTQAVVYNRVEIQKTQPETFAFRCNCKKYTFSAERVEKVLKGETTLRCKRCESQIVACAG